MRNVLGVRRVLGLALLLAAVAAVAYLDRSVGGDFDLRLVYFLIVLCGAMLLPRALALAIAAAVAIVSVGVIGATGTALIVNGLTHLLMYGYAALLTSNWEHERRRLMRLSRIDGLTGLRNLRALQEQLPTWLGPAGRTGRRMAVLMMDVDGFKTVNDHLGHGVATSCSRKLPTCCVSRSALATNRIASAATSSCCSSQTRTVRAQPSLPPASRRSTDRWDRRYGAPTSRSRSASALRSSRKTAPRPRR